MAGNLVRLFRRNLEHLNTVPTTSPHKAHIDKLGVIAKVQDDRWAKGKTLRAVDEVMVCNVGGHFAPHGPFPFASADAYYAWGSSHHVLPDVRVPLLALNAADDPIVRTVPTDCGANARVCVALTHAGGHLGWFEDSGRRWVVQPALEYFRALAEDLVPDHAPGEGEPGVQLEDGFWREKGRSHIGWRVVEDGQLIIADHGATGLVAGL